MIILRLRKISFRCINLAMENELLSTKQVAERLGVSVPRIRQLILTGKLPSQQIGRDHVIRESDLTLVKTYGKAGRPKKEGEVSGAAERPSGATPTPSKKKPAKLTAMQKKTVAEEQQRRWKGEQLTLPEVPSKKSPAVKAKATKKAKAEK